MIQLRLLRLLALISAILSVSCLAQSPIQSCQSLRSFPIPASAIALPTNGAQVDSAKLTHDSRGEYCEVLGRILSIDPHADPIRFEVNLPTQWNRKAVHFGGGLFDGWLGATNGLGRPAVAIASDPTPLARGFATFGSDSGHHHRYLFLPDALNVLRSSFALNPEEKLNFDHDGLKKTHDAAIAIIQQHYGTRPARTFFLGGSTGGREAYFVVQRWPDDYDGVLGAYAGWDQVQLDLQFIRVSQAMYASGGFLPKSKTRLLASSVLEQCDALDGAKDGIVANISACHFDPATLLCPAGRDNKTCLTSQQLHTVHVFATEQKTAQPLLNGVQTIPGYNVLTGADLTGAMGLFRHPETHPKIFLNSIYLLIGDGVLRNFLTGDPHFNALHFDTATGGAYSAGLLRESNASDASDSNLSRFAAHGGKFIILHGTADTTIPTNSSVLYYTMLQQTMGQEAVDRFVRFYLVPGYGHGRGTFDAGFDALDTLDHWLDNNTPPTSLTVIDNNKNSSGRTRPLCPYPTWPRYLGRGDLNSAASFTCAQPLPVVPLLVHSE
jgi:hypothetical protein